MFQTFFRFAVRTSIIALALGSQACGSVDDGSLQGEELGELSEAVVSSYRFVSVHSGKVLDVADWSTQNGGNVQQWTYGGGANQQWIYTATRFGWEIRNVHSNKCLDVDGPSNADGANVHQWDCHNGTSQRWQPGTDGRLVNAASGKCLDVAEWSTQNGGNVQQWTCTGGANQRWEWILN
jgi:hypothetical protein